MGKGMGVVEGGGLGKVCLEYGEGEWMWLWGGWRGCGMKEGGGIL